MRSRLTVAREMLWAFGDLAQTLASVAVLEDRTPVDVERPPADMPAFQAGAAHPCPHPFDDEVPFEFSDSSDDDDGPPKRAAGIKIFAEADELDVEVVELVQHLEEVANRPFTMVLPLVLGLCLA